MYDLFSQFFNGFDMFPETNLYNVKCPFCGRTYADFKKTGRLGCPDCYTAFRRELSQTMRQIHQNPVHKGKIPSHSRTELELKRRYADLKQQLSEAVRNEQYETAAKLHKEIKDIEQGGKLQ